MLLSTFSSWKTPETKKVLWQGEHWPFPSLHNCFDVHLLWLAERFRCIGLTQIHHHQRCIKREPLLGKFSHHNSPNRLPTFENSPNQLDSNEWEGRFDVRFKVIWVRVLDKDTGWLQCALESRRRQSALLEESGRLSPNSWFAPRSLPFAHYLNCSPALADSPAFGVHTHTQPTLLCRPLFVSQRAGGFSGADRKVCGDYTSPLSFQPFRPQISAIFAHKLWTLPGWHTLISSESVQWFSSGETAQLSLFPSSVFACLSLAALPDNSAVCGAETLFISTKLVSICLRVFGV